MHTQDTTNVFSEMTHNLVCIQIKTTLIDVDFNFDCRSLDMSDYVINKDQPRPVYKLIAVSVSMNGLIN